MLTLIADNQKRIAEICREHGVRRLDVFGSVIRDDFDPARSDVDLLVEFEAGTKPSLREYFELRDALEALLGRPVDLVMAGAVRNRYIKADIEATCQTIYAA